MQFDTLCNAKQSSAALIHHLLYPALPGATAVCSYCRLTITAPVHWHCRTCRRPPCDLCDGCAETALRHGAAGHEHPLVFAERRDYGHEEQHGHGAD